MVLGGQPWTNGNVLDADPAARALGVRRGMPLGSAHRLAPEATFLDADPEADRAELEAAFERLADFSPAIAGTSEPTDVAFGLLEAQIDGLEGLWGPEPALVERVGAALEPALAGRPRAGIAGTRFAATVAALAAEPGSLVSVPPGSEAEFLAPLPASLLTPDGDIRARLRRFTAPFVLRRLKTDRSIITDLPEKLEMEVLTNLTAEQAALYQAVVDDMLAKIEAAPSRGIRALVPDTA